MRHAAQRAPWELCITALACALLLGCPAAAVAAASRHALAAWVSPNGTQTSNPIDPTTNPTMEDLPLDKPPLVRGPGWGGSHVTGGMLLASAEPHPLCPRCRPAPRSAGSQRAYTSRCGALIQCWSAGRRAVSVAHRFSRHARFEGAHRPRLPPTAAPGRLRPPQSRARGPPATRRRRMMRLQWRG